jgi:hypothetical protein
VALYSVSASGRCSWRNDVTPTCRTSWTSKVRRCSNSSVDGLATELPLSSASCAMIAALVVAALNTSTLSGGASAEGSQIAAYNARRASNGIAVTMVVKNCFLQNQWCSSGSLA